MSKVIITSTAQIQIDDILENVVEFTGFENSAIRLYQELFDKIKQIGFMPLAIGRLRDDGKREAFARRYRIIYQYIESTDEVFILAVIHSSRLYPRP